MKTLNIESGKQQYDLAGKVTVEFCPTDMNFVEKVFSAFQKAEAAQKDVDGELKAADTEKVFEIARRRDAEMREIVNEVFGVDVCTPLFETMNVFAHSGGFPLWSNVLMAVMDECHDNLPEEEKATRARMEKYTKKYKKR